MHKLKNIHALSLDELKNNFRKVFPNIAMYARSSPDTEDFKENLSNFIRTHKNSNSQAATHLLRMIEYDGKTIFELSTEQDFHLSTFSILRQILRNELKEEACADILTDLYSQFYRLETGDITVDELPVKKFMDRWPTGTDEEIVRTREKNKKRIIKLLVKRVENKTNPNSLYHFPEGISEEEKESMVSEWWNKSRFHLSMAIKSPKTLNKFLDYSLSRETMEILTTGYKKKMPFFITPYYLSLLDTENSTYYDDNTIRSYILYSQNLVDTYGNIKAWEREDKIEPDKPNAAGWLLPEGNNIHRRYPEVAILIPDSMGRACGGLCASCQRMYDFQSERLNFDLESLLPKESWPKKLKRLMQYFEEDSQLRDILITGGDALMSQNTTLKRILDAIYEMSLRKIKANESRPEGKKYATLQRVRLGSRLPAYLPMRIDDELIRVLADFKQKALKAGIRQFIIQTHFQSPLEITPEAERAIKQLLSAGWIVTNQLVFNVAASRRGHTAKLRKELNKIGVLCYYSFSVKGFKENREVFVPNARSWQEKEEEKIYGTLNRQQQDELTSEINSGDWNAKKMKAFLKKHKLPFVSTDRNVLNLPGIGKSMTFETVGITPDGKRILKFTHDHERRHSPIIRQMEDVYIVENKSIRNYLKQMDDMGEKTFYYQSIWQYTEGRTEPRFQFYEYPPFHFETTKNMSNLSIE
jgi:lysine 2,3-aminomutase